MAGPKPGLRDPSGRNTLIGQRRQAEKLLRESPSLRSQLRALRDEARPDAALDAVNDTGLRPQTFAADCPFTVEQILDPGYLPDDEG